MDERIITLSIIGVGARGGDAYGSYFYKLKDKYKIVSLCDINPIRLKKYGDAYEVPGEDRFLSEDEFFKKKRSELLVIATLDKLHVRMAQKALMLGYDIMLEKPISDKIDELHELQDEAQKSGRKVMVCHVLRYTAMIRKIKEILDSGAIGEIVSIDQTENVVFWHEAHSYVRGNWRNREIAAPMIMAKCCHDMDLLQYFANSKCKSVSSMGSLSYFKRENQPNGAADRCVHCKYIDTCQYSAKRIYIEMWKRHGSPASMIPMIMITDTVPLTEESLYKAIEEGPYGRCAFACDNDVVDNQTSIMQFENGITATLKMEAFVKRGGRDIRFFGTEGELELIEGNNTITLKRYLEDEKVWYITDLTDDLEGHGGGDHRIIDAIYEVMINNQKSAATALDASLESHYMALAAEESRLNGGKLIEISKYRD